MPRYLALGREVGSCRSRSGGSDFSGINTKPWQPFQYQPRKEQVQKRKGHHHGQPDYASAAHWYRKAAQKVNDSDGEGGGRERGCVGVPYIFLCVLFLRRCYEQ